MSVIIDDTCITCDACLQNCPVGAIVDDSHNPINKTRYYVQPEKCIECLDIYENPQCAAICPSIGCISWDMAYIKEFENHFSNNDLYQISSKKERKYRKDIQFTMRGVGKKVEEAPCDN